VDTAAVLGAAVSRTGAAIAVVTAALAAVSALPARAELHYLIVAGLGGEPRYEEAFASHVEILADAAARTTGAASRVTVLSGPEATREALHEAVDALAGRLSASDSVAVFLVGHGSYDGEQYKFNLPGPDPDGAELSELLDRLPARAQLVVNASSASGAVLETLARDGRVVITATRSGNERNATRFPEHWAAALTSEAADANRNGVITAQEAFDYTARRVADSYESQGTLATEHPQIAGEGAARFEVARLAARVTMTPALERLYRERDGIEREIDELRAQRDSMPTNVYFDQLQPLLLALAELQDRIDEAQAE
jgi:hypothetical protein